MRISDWSSDVCSSDLIKLCRLRGWSATLGQFQYTHDPHMPPMRKRDEIAPPDRCMRPLNSSPVHAYVPRFRHILRHRTVLRQARKPQIFIDPLDLGAHEGGGCRGFSHAAPINPPSPQNAVRREMSASCPPGAGGRKMPSLHRSAPG